MRKSKGAGEIMAGVIATVIIGTGQVVGGITSAVVGYIHEIHMAKITAKKDFCTNGADCNLYYHFAGGKGPVPRVQLIPNGQPTPTIPIPQGQPAPVIPIPNAPGINVPIGG